MERWNNDDCPVEGDHTPFENFYCRKDKTIKGILRQRLTEMMIMLHEVGHFMYGHGFKISDEYSIIRMAAVAQDKVTSQELLADEFAASYLGYGRAAKALGYLRRREGKSPVFGNREKMGRGTETDHEGPGEDHGDGEAVR